MTDHPRRTPPTQGERVRVVASRAAPGSMLGGTRMAHPVRGAISSGGNGNVMVIIHGDDGTVPRPSATIVMWVGAATPANGVEYDFWYSANV